MPLICTVRPRLFAVAAALAAALPGLAAAEIPPDGFAGAYLAGTVAERRGDDGVAAAKLDTALALAPETPAPRRRVVRLMTSEGEFDRAAAEAGRVAAPGDDNFPIGLVRLAARFKSGDFDGAAAIANDPRANGVSTVVALLAKAWAQAGAGDVDAGGFERALEGRMLVDERQAGGSADHGVAVIGGDADGVLGGGELRQVFSLARRIAVVEIGPLAEDGHAQAGQIRQRRVERRLRREWADDDRHVSRLSASDRRFRTWRRRVRSRRRGGSTVRRAASIDGIASPASPPRPPARARASGSGRRR